MLLDSPLTVAIILLFLKARNCQNMSADYIPILRLLARALDARLVELQLQRSWPMARPAAVSSMPACVLTSG